MIVVDLETTGLDSGKHSIVSIGAIDFENKENSFYGECRIRDNSEIDDEALNVNGFTREQITTNTKSCEELLKDFLEWTKTVKDKTLGGHNVHFDWEFLREHFKTYKIEWPFRYKLVDLHSVFYFYLLKNKLLIPINNKVSAISLDLILDYFNIGKREGYHNALEDVKLTEKVFRLMME